jgi:site-specific recombinase XerD
MADKLYFLPVVSEFFSEYLPKTKGLSANTIRSYKYAFRLLFEYVHIKHNLLPEKIKFRHLEKGIVEAWLNWLCTDRKCSSKTRNNRLSALVTFARFVLRKNFSGTLIFCSDVEYLPKKKATTVQMRFIFRGKKCPFYSVCQTHKAESENAIG